MGSDLDCNLGSVLEIAFVNRTVRPLPESVALREALRRGELEDNRLQG